MFRGALMSLSQCQVSNNLRFVTYPEMNSELRNILKIWINNYNDTMGIKVSMHRSMNTVVIWDISLIHSLAYLAS